MRRVYTVKSITGPQKNPVRPIKRSCFHVFWLADHESEVILITHVGKFFFNLKKTSKTWQDMSMLLANTILKQCKVKCKLTHDRQP